jgi:type III restriction enzyme
MQKTLVSDLPEQEQENTTINRIRAKVDSWRGLGYPRLANPLTRELLDYWRNSERERKLFFCQIEALETLIYVSEVAKANGDEWIEEYLREAAAASGTPLFRLASKMATGSGKTVVMAMIIAWQTLNRCRNPNDLRYSDSFLLVAPNITIRDRLRVLMPSDPENYYRKLDIVPAELRSDLGTAKIVVTNFHAFKLKEKGEAGKLTKTILTQRQASSVFTESPEQMARRVCREFGRRKGIIVLNDEAHHCYRSKPLAEGEKLIGEERKEAEAREEEARLWINGLETINAKIGVKTVYDLSATPFYLNGSGYREGTLFPWVVSDFSLMDAIESGIVKTPRVPTSENAIGNALPTFRNLWQHVAADLPKKAKADGGILGEPVLPKELQAALHTLYDHYAAKYQAWEKAADGKAEGNPPPVFIVVCNNTNVSKMVFDYIGGRATGRTHPDGSPVITPGELPYFNNVADNRWLPTPNTILVDSAQLESEDGLSADFKQLAAVQIAEFHAEYNARTGRASEDLTDSDLMREVLNTVGKKGKLGEGIRCVVSVSMLTEGWDANTVTHILGVRAFGSSLLQEQVVGRGLRRMSYTLNDRGHFDPEYADVYGVPFRFLPVVGGGETGIPNPGPYPGNVKAEASRLALRPWLEIHYPRVAAYQYEIPPDVLTAKFTAESRLTLSVADLPTKTTSEPIVGQPVEMTLGELKTKRMQEIEFIIARLVAGKFAPPDPSGTSESYGPFAQLLPLVRRWIAECVEIKDHVFPQLLWLSEYRHSAAEKIHRAIRTESGGEPKIRAVLQSDEPFGTTALVSFDTLKKRYKTSVEKCHINFVPCNSDWEAAFAAVLEDASELPQVRAYVKNQNLGFRIPYTHEGKPRNYYPDYLVKIDDGHGPDDLLHLIVEISGQKKDDKQAKADTATNIWIPAVNALGTAGRWGYVELTDPACLIRDLKKFLRKLSA